MSLTAARLRRLWPASGVLGAAVAVGALTLVVRVLSLGRDMAVAAAFGIGDQVDAFQMASVLPAYAVNVVAGSLNVALVPAFVRARTAAGSEEARRLLSGAFALCLVALSGCAVVLAVSGPVLLPAMGSGFAPGKLELTRFLFLSLVPLTLLSGVSLVCAGALNAVGRFGMPAAASGAIPLAAVCFLLAGVERWGVAALALGTVAGAAVEVAVLALALRRAGLALTPRWYGLTPEMRHVIAQFWPAAAGQALVSGVAPVDQAVAAALPAGSIAVLAYGSRIPVFVATLSATALSTALLPHFSTLIAARRAAEARRTLWRYSLALILPVTVPAALLLVALSQPIVAVAFQRGSFSREDAVAVAGVQAVYALHIPFFILVTVAVRLLNAAARNRDLLGIAAVMVVMNTVADILLSRWFGPTGIALSTVLVHLSAAVLSFYVVWKRVRGG